MRPTRRKAWFVVAGVILLLAFVGARVTGGLLGGGRDADRRGTSLPVGVDEGGGVGLTGEDGANGDGVGGTGNTGPAAGESGVEDPDVVPTAVVYDLVDQLRAAGTGPVVGTDLIVEYEGDARDVIVMRGQFEGTSASEVRFERRGGAWSLAETE